MFRVYYFTAMDSFSPDEQGKQIYGDCGRLQMRQNHRPMVGDLVPSTVIMTIGGPPWVDDEGGGLGAAHHAMRDYLRGQTLLRIEEVMYVGNDAFYAYCVEVAKIDGVEWTICDGERGNPQEILYHYIEQENSFARGGKEPIDRELFWNQD